MKKASGVNIVSCSINFAELSPDEKSNIININKIDYRLNYLEQKKGNKGGNSWVFALYNAQEDLGDENPIAAIKINKKEYFIDDKKCNRKDNKRIDAEIDALIKCKDKKANYVIDIISDGILKNTIKNETHYHRFYVMEYATCDLKTFKEDKTYQIDVYDSIKICIELTKSLKELFELGYYHRDIKPDNFFYFASGKWKVGDLGLVEKRNSVRSLDYPQEFIGPRGWTSPETMNKYLVDVNDLRFDRFIDEKSDMFQLGMVFWYVLQGNAPIGCIMEKDFIIDNHPLYALIRTMISYPKALRPSCFDDIINRLNQIADNYLINI